MLDRGQREKIVLNKHRVRVGRMESPLEVIVRKVADDHDVVRLFSTTAEIPIKHDACSWSNRLHPRSGCARDVETLNDDVMRRLQQYHPIRIARRGTVYNAVAWLTKRLEMNVTTVTSVGFIAQHETGVGPRH